MSYIRTSLSKRKKSMDDGYETGPPSASTSASSGAATASSSKSRSPQRSSSCSASSGATRPYPMNKRSMGSTSLPSPAHVTDEARRVLEAFLQRSMSMDRGSTSSVAAILPRHLEVIEEIRHTRIRNDSYHRATGDDADGPGSPRWPPTRSDTEPSTPGTMASTVATAMATAESSDEDEFVDGVTVTAHVVGSPAIITDIEVEHQHHSGQPHTTDVDLHLRAGNETSLVHTHITHPRINDAALAVTTGAAEMYMDASLSRQASGVEMEPAAAVAFSTPDDLFARPTPASRAYEADAERQTPSAADRKGKKKLSRESIRGWIRSLKTRTTDDEVPDSADGERVLGASANEWSSTSQRPRYYTMDSTSSTTSTSTFGGAPARSVVRREDLPTKSKRKKKRRRSSSLFASRTKAHGGGREESTGSSFFHQLFRMTRYTSPRIEEPAVLAPALSAEQVARWAVDLQDAPAITVEPQPAAVAVGEIFRNAIDSRESVPSMRVDQGVIGGTDITDRTTLRLDLGSSSASSQNHCLCSSPEGVSSPGNVDKVARMLDRMANEINLLMTSDSGEFVNHGRVRSESVPGLDQRRRSLPDNDVPLNRNRPGSARVTKNKEEERTVPASTSTPQLGAFKPNGDQFDPKRALRAKASRIKHQSSECLVDMVLLDSLRACTRYEEFAAILNNWFGNRPVNWKKIAMFYHLVRKLVRLVNKEENNSDQTTLVKNFAMTYFHYNYANFVVHRGGWQTVIEDTEDSELD